MSNHEPISRDYGLADQPAPPDDPVVVQKHADLDEQNDGTTSPRKRLTRAVGKGVDNITKSFISGSGRSTPQQPQTAASPAGSRRLFNLNRKGKAKDLSQSSGSPDGKSLSICYMPIEFAPGDGSTAQGIYSFRKPNGPNLILLLLQVQMMILHS